MIMQTVRNVSRIVVRRFAGAGGSRPAFVMSTRIEAIRKDVSVAGSALIRQRERLVMQQQVRDRSGHGR